jgi:hypothetical protein
MNSFWQPISYRIKDLGLLFKPFFAFHFLCVFVCSVVLQCFCNKLLHKFTTTTRWWIIGFKGNNMKHTVFRQSTLE